MKFTPQPPNDFQHFHDLYYAECRRRFPRIAAIAAKWRFEDLIPGLSDFDTRFVVEDGMTVQDWCDMSEAVGQVHLDLCRRHPHWARNLEHLPGINLTWTELNDPQAYYPEYRQWTFYRSEDAARLEATLDMLARRPWSPLDELFHLKKFCLYYGRYSRTIDPAVNLGPYENKYPLHSRFMHYFCPPLQAALCILHRRPVAGKMETVRLACEAFPEPVFREMLDAVERHYEVPELYEEPALTRLEDRLEQALEMLRMRLGAVLTVIPGAQGGSVADWKAALSAVPVSPATRVFDAARFCRLMKGRLRFWANAPPHFDSTWPIENELLRLRRNFFDIPFGVYWEVTTGEKVKDPSPVLDRLAAGVLSAEELRCTREFVRLTPGQWEPGRQKATALAIAEVFDGFFGALTRVTARVAEFS
jgi:hypothetical protein